MTAPFLSLRQRSVDDDPRCQVEAIHNTNEPVWVQSSSGKVAGDTGHGRPRVQKDDPAKRDPGSTGIKDVHLNKRPRTRHAEQTRQRQNILSSGLSWLKLSEGTSITPLGWKYWVHVHLKLEPSRVNYVIHTEQLAGSAEARPPRAPIVFPWLWGGLALLLCNQTTCFPSDDVVTELESYLSMVLDKARFWIRVYYPESYLSMVLDEARFWIRVDYPESCLSMVLDEARFWIRVDYPESYLSMVLDEARFWIRVDYPESYLSMVLDEARFWIRVYYPESYLSMVLDEARFWIRVDYPESYLSMVLDEARFWIRVDYLESCLSMVLDEARFWIQ
ncbi:hypothetical protein Bbelb_250050 [Branchiostoma belcheri]|nr:hypothetical protein Bbelb_250050 [Branchiostoma belcheri]